MSARLLAQTTGGGHFLVAAGQGDLGPFTPARVYDVRRDSLSDELWLGSFVKFLGGYLEDVALDDAEGERLLARIAELVAAEDPPSPR